ncbi:phospholipid carrier-dependent glycosyltransferase [Marinagarivorans algicola]|uniref:phospholipid carrier-dependent glycosyltransferase n=1 Tax=Marinagarivorans algicola TaxID=1513270 RepID=UPI0006B4E2E0|nr:phospholipid carrier-dependent glycosyltransferase [Marinagarivorans algicola]
MTDPNSFVTLLGRHKAWLTPGVLLVASLLMFLAGLQYPKSMFWDENYHVVSAQKHVDGMMYMEPHPPLGKMIMGLSEAIFQPNADRDMSALLKTDYLKGAEMPKGMEFWAFRLPSALMMALSVWFLYQILFRITRYQPVAFVFSLFIIFDNAMVLHSRSAMLEGIQFFFILLSLWYFVRIVTQNIPITLKHYLILGTTVGLVTAVKVNGLVLSLVYGMLLLEDKGKALLNKEFMACLERVVLSVVTFFGSLAFVFCFVFYIHIGLGDKVEPTKKYKASPEYLQSLEQNGGFSFTTFRIGFKDHMRYSSEYASGVPRLDICKDTENGSYYAKWPFGGKGINYRWSKNTIDGVTKVSYSYLVGNPLIWLTVIAGILLSISLIIGRFVFDLPSKDDRLFMYILYFCGMYLSYMIAIAQIDRVMYLYHYFVPLLFGIINAALVFTYVFKEALASGSRLTWINLGVFGVLVVAVFAYFSPFTFGIPITEAQFELRNWFSLWDIEVVR